MNAGHATQRSDFAAIAEWVKPRSRVLDLGCGDGSLLKYLKEQRSTSGLGVEIDDASILACVRNGTNVVQSDLERGLSDFEDNSFDYVILSQTLQTVRHSERIIREMLRVGLEGIVTFPNFGYWKNRLQVAAGRMPVSANLPFQWYDTPNVHLCTISDFERFCRERGVRVIKSKVLTNGTTVRAWPNLLGALAVYHFGSG